MNELTERIRKFARDRQWDQFHNPKNLTMAIAGETGELNEIFQWLTPEQSVNLTPDQLQDVQDEVADIYIYLLRLCDKLNIDLQAAANEKIKKNEKKYPISLSKNNAIKYNKRK